MLLDFAAQRLAPALRDEITTHTADCAPCRLALSGLARAEVRVPLTAGGQLGRYTLRTPLGRGAMGVVWAATDPELGREVAIKVLYARDASVDEARALARVAHPHVVPVFDAGVANGQTYLVMELVSGTTLRNWMATEHSWQAIVAVLVDAGLGLAAVHAAGLLHCDFKPDNVLIGDDGRARVTDFGLARPHSIHTDAETAGTPGYLAPEQLAGHALDARADQFAFCVTFHEALFGVRPGKHAPSQASKAPRWLRALVMRGLSPDREARWPSMAALVAELGAAPRRRRVAIVGAAFFSLAAPLLWLLTLHLPDADRTCRIETRAIGKELVGAHPTDEDLAVAVREWVRVRVGVCEDANVASARVRFGRRMACLDQWRATAAAGSPTNLLPRACLEPD